MEAWADQPDVTTPILKFMSELTYNKANRIAFGVCSPNGYLLFRLVSQVVVAYGRRVIHFPKEGNQYRLRLKGMWISFVVVSRALSGHYANFSVFQLFGQSTLSGVIKVTLEMMKTLTPKDIVEYKKLGKAYFPLIDMLLSNHMDFVAKLDFQGFSSIMAAIEAGLKSFDVSFCSACAAAIDNLATFYYTHVVAPTGSMSETAKGLEQHIQMCPVLFPNLLRMLMDIALFEEAREMRSLSRPILALIVINETGFAQIKDELARGHPEDRQQHIVQCLAKLMDDVERNLDPKNRDTFTHNLSTLKHCFEGNKWRFTL